MDLPAFLRGVGGAANIYGQYRHDHEPPTPGSASAAPGTDATGRPPDRDKWLRMIMAVMGVPQ